MVAFTCPHCGAPHEAPVDRVGRSVWCRGCRRIIRASEPGPASGPLSAPGPLPDTMHGPTSVSGPRTEIGRSPGRASASGTEPEWSAFEVGEDLAGDGALSHPADGPPADLEGLELEPLRIVAGFDDLWILPDVGPDAPCELEEETVPVPHETDHFEAPLPEPPIDPDELRARIDQTVLAAREQATCLREAAARMEREETALRTEVDRIMASLSRAAGVDADARADEPALQAADRRGAYEGDAVDATDESDTSPRRGLVGMLESFMRRKRSNG